MRDCVACRAAVSRWLSFRLAALLISTTREAGAAKIPTPSESLGFEVGADRKLAIPADRFYFETLQAPPRA